MTKDVLNKRNRYKRLICRTGDGLALIEIPDRRTADGLTVFRFAVAHTDHDGNSILDDGIVLSYAELAKLGKMITEALDDGSIRETALWGEYEREFPAPAPKPKQHLW